MEYKTWEYMGNNSNACYARTLRAAVDFGAKIYATHRHGGKTYANDPWTAVSFLISVPEGQESDFAQATKMHFKPQTIAGV